MMKLRITLSFFLFVIAYNSSFSQDQFYAYHTNVPHTSTDYFGKYADLIVVIGEDRQLEFMRRNQYSPQWITSEGTFPIDEFFPEREKDFTLDYTYVRLLEQSAEKIVVHWRYMPDVSSVEAAVLDLNSTFYEGFTNVVHEKFTIYPTGRIEREVRDARGSKYDNWSSPDYSDKQNIELKNEGITYGKVNWGDKRSLAPKASPKNPIISTTSLTKPVLAWTFDEGGKDYPSGLQENMEEDPNQTIMKSFEHINQILTPITGHTTVYKKGVSGTSLGFDGYYTGVSIPKFAREQGSTYFNKVNVPKFKDSMSIEAWVALDVYPYNVAPIVHQSKNFGEQGFYFGIDQLGHLTMTVNGTSVVSTSVLDLYRWTHVSSVIQQGKITLYIDGNIVGSTKLNGSIGNTDAEFLIGLNSERERPSDYVRGPMQNIPFIYGIQGMLDEVKIYDQSLSKNQISQHHKAFLPSDRTSPLNKAVLPGEVGVGEKFGAYYKNLEHHELWDKMWRLSDETDIIVKFDDNPASVVYWRGTNFAANWVTDNNRWMADQSSEMFTKYGCSEHMADKQTRHSYARIIENNEARVVIHWRYPCVDVGYICTDKRNWTDEYHTIYPDGTAVRKVIFNKSESPGFQDIQYFTNPGETATDVVNMNAMTVANLKGETLELVWEKPNKNPEQKLEDATIEWLNSKSEWKVFTVFQGPGISTWGKNEQSKYTDDPFAGPWNHWPVSLVPSDGRYAVAHDRVTHFALGANDFAPNHGSMVHYGFTNQKIDKVIPVARYWQNPPQIRGLKGAASAEFKKEEKAYFLKGNTTGKISFKIEASKDSPVINPAFVINNTGFNNPKVKFNGKVFEEGKDLRIGQSYDVDGEPFTIIWLRAESTQSVKIEIE